MSTATAEQPTSGHPPAASARTRPGGLLRNLVTPLAAVSFLVSAVTGVMLLLHWQAGLVRVSHEWLSLVFVAAGVWHLARNWRAGLGYLRRRAAVAVLGASLAAALAFTFATAAPPSAASPGAVFAALSRAPLAAAAPAFGLTPDQAVAKLAGAAIAARPEETLAAIAERAGSTGAGIASRLARGGR